LINEENVVKTKLFRIGSIALLAVLILALVTITAWAIAKSNLAKKYPAPGQLVNGAGIRYIFTAQVREALRLF
jgi:hypothetical protein